MFICKNNIVIDKDKEIITLYSHNAVQISACVLKSFKRGRNAGQLGETNYSRTSVARTLMTRLPRLFRTRSCVPRKNPLAADLR